jgi:predicted permease
MSARGATLWRESVRTFRGWVRRPSSVAAAVVLLSMGVGAATILLSALYAASVGALPYREPTRLVQAMTYTNPACAPRCLDLVSGEQLTQWRARSTSFEGFGAAQLARMELTVGAASHDVAVAVADSLLFKQLSVRPVLGRALVADDFEPGAPRAVVIGFRLWHDVFGADPKVVGRTFRLDSSSATVVGLMPANLEFPQRAEAWVAARKSTALDDSTKSFSVVARLRSGVSVDASSRELNAIARAGASQKSAHDGAPSGVAVGMNWIAKSHVQESAIILCVVVATLLIACANLAGLAVARMLARGQEFAIRMAIGASRTQLRQLLLIEGMMLGALSGVAGLVLAVWIRPFAATMIESDFGFPVALRLPAELATAVIAASVLLGILVVLPSAHIVGDRDPNDSLRGGSSTATKSTRTTRSALLVFEIATALILVSGAGVLTTVVVRLRTLDLGYDASHLILGQVSIPNGIHDGASVDAVGSQITAALQHVPSAKAIAYYYEVYPRNAQGPAPKLIVEGGSTEFPWTSIPPYEYRVSDRFFSAMGLELTRGRTFGPADIEGGAPVAIINEEAAAKWFPGSSPLGKRFRLRFDERDVEPLTVVGVVPNTATVGDAAVFGKINNAGFFPLVFRPARQPAMSKRGVQSLTFLVQTIGDPSAAVEPTRRLTESLAPQIKLTQLSDMRVASSSFGPLSAANLRAQLLVAFALVGAVLAVIGVFAIVSDSVQRRRREIGIRVALGAPRRAVVRLLARDALNVTLVGGAAGTCGAIALNRFLASMVQGVGSVSFVAIAFGAAGVLLVAVATSALLAAMAAGSVSPLSVIRTE